MEKELNLDDKIWGDYIRIIIDPEYDYGKNGERKLIKNGVVIEKMVHDEKKESITFNDCVAIAKENGFTEGTFLIMADTPLEGTIYQYANCYEGEPFVSEYGKTREYA